MSKVAILKNGIIYIVFEALNKSLPFLLLPILTHYLTPGGLGLIAEFVSLTGIFAAFTGLSVHGAVNVAYFKLNAKEMPVYVFNVFLILLLSTIFVLLVAVAGSSIYDENYNLPTKWLYLAVVLSATQFVTTINLVLWQSEKKAINYSLYQSLQTILKFSLIILFVVLLGVGWEGQIYGSAIAMLFFALISLFVLYRREYLRPIINIEYIKDALKFGVPLIPHQLAAWVFMGFNILLISSYLSKEEAGIFSVAIQFALIMYVLTQAANRAIQPFLYDKLKNINEDDKRVIVRFTYLGFVITIVVGLCLWGFSMFIIDIFVDEHFHKAKKYLFFLIMAGVLDGFYLLVVNYIFYVKKTQHLAAITLISAVIHIATALVLIDIIGMMGVALASVISGVSYFVLTWMLSARVYHMSWFGKAV